MSLPNLLTILRLLLTPVVGALMLDGRHAAAGTVFAAAAATDALDGWLARRLGQVTVIGQLLDPFVDKVLVDTTLICAAALGLLPAWLALVICGRDLFVLAGSVLTRALRIKYRLLPGLLGKAAVAVQMLLLVVVLLEEWLPAPAPVEWLLIALAAGLSLVSAALYASAWLRSASAAAAGRVAAGRGRPPGSGAARRG